MTKVFQLYKDDELIHEAENEFDLWQKLHRIQSQSVDWALKYGGYSIVEREEEKQDAPTGS